MNFFPIAVIIQVCKHNYGLNRNLLGKRLIFQLVLQDEILRMAVQRFKGKNWKKIGKKMGLGLHAVNYSIHLL